MRRPGGTAFERKGNIFDQFQDFPLKNGASQCQNLALTVLFVPISVGSGMCGSTKCFSNALSFEARNETHVILGFLYKSGSL